MNLISLEKAAKAYAHRRLLDGVARGVGRGPDRGGRPQRRGEVHAARRMLAGLTEPDEGRVARAAGLRIGYLPQADRLAGR